MAEEKTMRLKQVATTLNISTSTVVDFLAAKGFDIENKPTSKITSKQFEVLMSAFESSVQAKIEAEKLNIGKKPVGAPALPEVPEPPKKPEIVNTPKPVPAPPVTPQANTVVDQPLADTGVKLPGIKVVGKIDLNAPRVPVAKPVEVPQQPEALPEEPVVQAPKEEKPEAAPEIPAPVAEERQPEPIIVPEPEVVAPQPAATPEPVATIESVPQEPIQEPVINKAPEEQSEPVVAASTLR